ncbi:unnamed protein product [Phytophthora fragariaefolia]|uniref:Unnamed protein product n=1 Tax=Phytophthora fragariaefolia TaxID=1490495 RepID=A0A9W6X683_9STRA|nr:unnamed protein product [Phytophthora fragariaefolia]
MSSLQRRFHANVARLQAQEQEIERLQQQNLQQSRRIDEADEAHEKQVVELRSELAERDRMLQEQDADMDHATQTIGMLMQQVQALRGLAARAEQAQRDAEADQILRHVSRDSDDGGVDAEAVQQLRDELRTSLEAQQQSSRQVCQLEEERTWLKETAEMLSVELQDLNNAKVELERQMQSDQNARQQVEKEKVKADEEICRLKMAVGLREEILTVLQSQVKTMCTDREKLENAIVCCQRSADHRLRTLEKDRQLMEAENHRLRDELSALRQELVRLDRMLRSLENDEFNVMSDYDGLEREAAMEVDSIDTHGVKVELGVAATTVAASSSVIAVAHPAENSQEQYVDELAGVEPYQS